MAIGGVAQMTYKQYITQKCEEYATKKNVQFIGYNTAFGSRMYGTLLSIPSDKCLECPVAENLMLGMGVGMALEGYRPVVCFERHDFLLLAMDALINHVDKLAWISGDQFKLPIIIRAIVGGQHPINPGPMHTQDYTSSLRIALKHTPVYVPRNKMEFDRAWAEVGLTESGAVVIVEYRDDYDKEL